MAVKTETTSGVLSMKLGQLEKQELEIHASKGFERARRIASALLLLDAGKAVSAVARETGVSRQSVHAWRKRFAREGMGFIRKAPSRDMATPNPEGLKTSVKKLTQGNEKTVSAASLAARLNVSQSTIYRIWAELGIPPPKQNWAHSPEAGKSMNYGPTLADVARKANVSKSTASLAFRNQKGIHSRTRENVLKAAGELGYRPHPYHSIMMAHIEHARYREIGSEIVWLHNESIPFRDAYKLPWGPRPRFESAARRAKSLGYRLSPVRLNDPNLPLSRLSTILKNRNIRGLILNIDPQAANTSEFDFDAFASVSFNRLERPTHVVQENTYLNMLLACEALWNRGYRRFGFVASRSSARLSGWLSLAAFTLFQKMMLRDKDTISHLFFDYHLDEDSTLSLSQKEKEFRGISIIGEWYGKNRPDVILTQFGTTKDLLQRNGISVPGDVGLAHLNIHEDVSGWSGIQCGEDEVGTGAIELLHKLITLNETGLPSHPTTIIHEGTWVDGTTTRAQKTGTQNQYPPELEWLRNISRHFSKYESDKFKNSRD